MKRLVRSDRWGVYPIWVALVSGLVSCGGTAPRPIDAEYAQADGKSGASKKADEDAPDGGSYLAEPSGDPSTAPLAGCRLDAPLPPDVPADADAADLHLLGQGRILAKDGPQAVAILAAAEKKDPQSAVIVGDLATALLQCRMYDDAIRHATQAAALEPDNVDIAANLAQTYQIAGRIDDAVNAYQRALEVSPQDAAVHNNLAVLLLLTDLDAALKASRKAVDIEPKNATYLINLGYILYRKDRLVDAEMILERAIESDPESADAHNQIGIVYAAQNRNIRAADSFRKALRLRPDHRAAKENLEAVEGRY
ncbi:MAG: tetratricopeptide repeat protein [Myxococcota bacterium]|nr:tetratricopeptide repeat protein [Myxococcota bacterium]